MPVFAYVAKTTEEQIVRGTIAGDSPRHARDLIREQGLAIVEFSPAKASKERGFSLFKSSAAKNVGTFASDLSTLLAVGVPLLEGLETLEKQYTGPIRQSVTHLKDQVASGKNLAEAMALQPITYDRLCLKMVEVGESTGELDRVLNQLAEFKRKANQFQDRVLTSLLYPIVVLAVSVAVTIFLMTVVIPMLLENLIEAGRPLPWPTRVLKFGSDLLLDYGLFLLVGLVLLGFGVAAYLKTENGARVWYGTILKMPVLGSMYQKQEVGRISLIIATLLKSGVEFLDAVEIAQGTSKNPLLRDALSVCATQIRSGKEVGQAMSETSFFPPMVVQIYTIGQQSGQIDDMLLRLSEDYDRQVESMANKLSTLIEPVLILVLSLFVGFILFATLLPILEAGNVL